jgi:hypothetical protein
MEFHENAQSKWKSGQDVSTQRNPTKSSETAMGKVVSSKETDNRPDEVTLDDDSDQYLWGV